MLFFKNWFLIENVVHYFPYVASAIFVGNGLGAYLPFLFLDENEKNKDILFNQYKNMFLCFIITTVFNFFLSLFLMKNISPGF